MAKFSRFESIGVYLPSKTVSTKDMISQMEYPQPFDLEQITGIKERRVHDNSEDRFEDSFVLGLNAARDCLSRSRYNPEDIDVIISGSITHYKGGYKHYFEPSMALFLSKAIGARSASVFDLSNACAGMLTGVNIIDKMIKAGIVRNGMVVSGECITPIADTALKEIREPLDPQFGSLTVGDSGAAVILDGAQDEQDIIHYVEQMTCAEHSRLCLGMPSDKNGQPALYTNNLEMHKKDRVKLWPHFQMDLLRRRGSSFAEEKFDYIIHHQVGDKAMEKFSAFASEIFKTEMPPHLSVVEKYGNTATTSHFVVLHDYLKNNETKAGTKILMVPAASGVVTGCLSTTITSLEV